MGNGKKILSFKAWVCLKFLVFICRFSKRFCEGLYACIVMDIIKPRLHGDNKFQKAIAIYVFMNAEKKYGPKDEEYILKLIKEHLEETKVEA